MNFLLQVLYLIAVKAITLIQPFLVPLCFVLAWGIVLLTIWQVMSAMRDGWVRAKRMHQIPCADCQYFTNSHFLKCPLHPTSALSEAAINCQDYEDNYPLASLPQD